MHVNQLLSMPENKATSETSWLYNNLSIPKDWSQGRTSYGGISAGMVFSAIQEHADDAQCLRAYTTNFIGPIALETPFDIVVESLRVGKNVAQFLGKIVQDGKTCVICQAVFGTPRASNVTVANKDSHDMTPPKKGNFIPQIPKVTPKFLRHFDLSVEGGGMPFTRKKTSHYHGWMRYKEAPESVQMAHLITIIDAWPPTLLQMLKWPAPASTISWHIDFLHPMPDIAGDAWLAYQADTRQANDGYGHTEATIWSQTHQAIAISRQTVAIFD
ncbi:thioesterase family protein [Alteromonas sediminis]|uniref:Thioesterase family protein n=1 Tax=Alteromonas sediminis TaxID=2259342 RepID=A0A3N5YCY7_9ALTE|nr:thioesterase family protein [Alteromonas sediminis]RPJ67265.1 thioesterase family protein [Alteromonas sediminis]